MTPQGTAVCMSCLKAGFFRKNPSETKTYENHADIHGGHIGIVIDFYNYAEWIEQHLETHYRHIEDWPGVFHYEVTEELGQWLFENPDTFTNSGVSSSFVEHATDEIALWFVTGRLAQ